MTLVNTIGVGRSRQVGRSGLRVAPIGLGTATFGREVPLDRAVQLVSDFLDAGGNHIDTADTYAGGEAERAVGTAIRGRRDEVIVASKVGLPLFPGTDRHRGARRHLRRSVEGSLKRLNTDRLDVLYVHRWDGDIELEETMRIMDDLVRWGLVEHVAVSNWTGWQSAWAVALARSHGWTAPVMMQGRYSLLERDVEREILPYCSWAGLGFVAHSPLCGGLLSGKYGGKDKFAKGTRAADPQLGASLRHRMTESNAAVVNALCLESEALGASPAQLAIAWLLNRRAVSGVVVGVTSAEQLAEAIAAPSVQVEPLLIARLVAAGALSRGYPHDLLSELDCDGDEGGLWS